MLNLFCKNKEKTNTNFVEMREAPTEMVKVICYWQHCYASIKNMHYAIYALLFIHPINHISM